MYFFDLLIINVAVTFYWDSNTQPFDRESPTSTTRPVANLINPSS